MKIKTIKFRHAPPAELSFEPDCNPLIELCCPPTYDSAGTFMTAREARTLGNALLKFADLADKKRGK